MKIWLVEDDAAQSDLVGLLLKQIAPNVIFQPVSNADELMDSLQSGKENEIIITDLRMPKINGLDLLKKLKTNILYSYMPVLVMSASDLRTDVDAAYRDGANAYLVKPSNLEDFELLLRRVVDFWSLACT